jgi:hypothetical protein
VQVVNPGIGFVAVSALERVFLENVGCDYAQPRPVGSMRLSDGPGSGSKRLNKDRETLLQRNGSKPARSGLRQKPRSRRAEFFALPSLRRSGLLFKLFDRR